MRVTVLAYVDREGSKQYDVVVDQVAEALRANGHAVSILGVRAGVQRLIDGLAEQKPELVFNLVEQFGDNLNGDIAVAGLLDLLGIPFTGSGAGDLYLANDKALGKKLLAFENILFPNFAVFSKDAGFETGGNLRMPLFVKPVRMDASIGIGARSLVSDSSALMKQVLKIHDECGDAALAEEYIEGRELYVGVLGNGQPVALPAIEIDFTGFPEGKPKIMDDKAKFDEKSAEYKGTAAVLAELPDELRARLERTALDAYRALRIKDYGRVDLRLAATGDIYVLEVNAGCYLERESEFAVAAAAAGTDYDALIQKIVELAVERQGPAKKKK